jgi:hypothetical protein
VNIVRRNPHSFRVVFRLTPPVIHYLRINQMKKSLSLVLAALFAVTLAACGKKEEAKPAPAPAAAPAPAGK